MARKNIHLILWVALVAAFVAGCQESSRIDRVRPRWQQTMDRARLEAAEKELEAGRPAYAERLLSDCRYETYPESSLAEQIQKLRARIRTDYHQYAGTETPPAADVEQTAY